MSKSSAWSSRVPVTLTDDDDTLIGTTDAPLAVSVVDAPRQFISYERQPAISTVKPLPNIPSDAKMAVVIVEDFDVRVRYDSTPPTSTIGMPIFAGTGVKLYGSQIAAARFIEQDAGAILNVEYYR